MKKRSLLIYIPCLILIYCLSLFTASMAFSGPPLPRPPMPGHPFPKPPRHPRPRMPVPVPRPPVPIPGPRVHVPPPGIVHPGPPPPPRVVHRHLPAGVVSLHVAGALFYYHLGLYYRQTDQGYVTVDAPIGGQIEILPGGCSSFRVNDRLYYNCADAYYEPYGNSFIVVEPPVPVQRDVEPIATTGDKVKITANTLNVRSGPGTRFRVMSTLYRGQTVKVDSVDRGWYYVIMPDGSYGWIMSKYTLLKQHHRGNKNNKTKG